MEKRSADHKVIKADRKLQVKAGSGDVDQKAVERAETFVQSNKVVYADVVAPILLTLKTSIEALKKMPADREPHVQGVKNAVMDLKGSAATFHYPLVSRLCKPILLHLESSATIDPETLKLLDILYHLVSIVVKTSESETANAFGDELEKTFIEACNKISSNLTKD